MDRSQKNIWNFKKVISKFREIPKVEFTTKITRKAYGTLQLQEKVGLFDTLDTLSTPVRESMPLSMEELGQNYGYVLYRSTITRGKEIQSCEIRGGMDRAIIFADGKQVEIRNDDEMDRTTGFELKEEKGVLDILMENREESITDRKLTCRKKELHMGFRLTEHSIWVGICTPFHWTMYRE